MDDHANHGHPFADRYRLLDAHAGREDAAAPTSGRRSRSTLRALASRQGALADRLVLRAMEGLFLSADPPKLSKDPRGRFEHARATYCSAEIARDPASFFRTPAQPPEVRVRELGRLRAGARRRLTFRSPYRTFDPDYQPAYDAFGRNAIARVTLLQHDAAGRPTVVCVHTWCGGIPQIDAYLFAAESLYREGLNVALFTMPFHGSRTPQQARFSGQLFPSRELRRTNEAFGQAVTDLRVLLGWLRREAQSGPIGMMGMSLGGYTTALMAGLEDSLAFAIPIIAPCSFADILWHHGKGRPGREEAERAGFTLADLRALWSVHCPLVHALRVPKDRVLLVWGEGDRIVPGVHQLALWEHWGRPDVHAFAGGHLLHAGRAEVLAVTRRWLRSRVA